VQIKSQTADERAPIRFRGGRKPFLREGGQDEMIDWIPRPIGIMDGWQRRLFERLQGPQR